MPRRSLDYTGPARRTRATSNGRTAYIGLGSAAEFGLRKANQTHQRQAPTQLENATASARRVRIPLLQSLVAQRQAREARRQAKEALRQAQEAKRPAHKIKKGQRRENQLGQATLEEQRQGQQEDQETGTTERSSTCPRETNSSGLSNQVPTASARCPTTGSARLPTTGSAYFWAQRKAREAKLQALKFHYRQHREKPRLDSHNKNDKPGKNRSGKSSRDWPGSDRPKKTSYRSISRKASRDWQSNDKSLKSGSGRLIRLIRDRPQHN
ncbi:hypothetical protein JTE90_008906 [Oedothorax gibbosus]|uniref:Uncharacterized protein n=1 Tax=Oedothorax gibbosus TaxID=931172 RepID=A0AAV6UKH6_9ARAC|nr:hypothetical protein JTE90_008906 [Oedothorax gibbosus]